MHARSSRTPGPECPRRPRSPREAFQTQEPVADEAQAGAGVGAPANILNTQTAATANSPAIKPAACCSVLLLTVMAKPYDTTPNRLLSLPRARTRTDPYRKKACAACARSKAKCDHSRPTCSRCGLRSIECQYGVAPSQRAFPALDTGSIETGHPSSGRDDGPGPHLEFSSSPDLIPARAREPVNAQHFPSPESSSTPNVHHGVSLQDELLPLPTPGRISFRWLATMLPPPLPKAKHFSPLAIHVCKSFLRTLPLRLVSRDPPPFIHSTQLSPSPCEPLANAITITRMWYERVGGSEELVSRTIASEMESIVRKVCVYEVLVLLWFWAKFWAMRVVLSQGESNLLTTHPSTLARIIRRSKFPRRLPVLPHPRHPLVPPHQQRHDKTGHPPQPPIPLRPGHLHLGPHMPTSNPRKRPRSLAHRLHPRRGLAAEYLPRVRV
jgi:hypothetical protein